MLSIKYYKPRNWKKNVYSYLFAATKQFYKIISKYMTIKNEG